MSICTDDICRRNRLFRIYSSHTKWKSEFKSPLVYRGLSSTTDSYRQLIWCHIDCQSNDRRLTCVFPLQSVIFCVPAPAFQRHYHQRVLLSLATIQFDYKRILKFQTDRSTLQNTDTKKITYFNNTVSIESCTDSPQTECRTQLICWACHRATTNTETK